MNLRTASLTLAVLAVAICSGPGRAHAADVCIPYIGSVTGGPTHDGLVRGDVGWNGAAQLNLDGNANDNMDSATSAVYLGRRGSNLYLGFDVEEPAGDTGYTTIVIFLSPDTSQAGEPDYGEGPGDWRIHINPFGAGGAIKEGGVPETIAYWRGRPWCGEGHCCRDNPPASSCCMDQCTDPARKSYAGSGHFLYNATRVGRSGNRWSVEMVIPFSNEGGIELPSNASFKLYTNILKTYDLAQIDAVLQTPWPEDQRLSHSTYNLDVADIPKANWGTASFTSRPECTGVYFSASDVGVWHEGALRNTIRREQNPDCASNVASGPTNEFRATVHSDLQGSAPEVSATFRIADFGLPGPNDNDADWTVISADSAENGNPTALQPVGSGPTGSTFKTFWSLTGLESCEYAPPSNHQCLLVELSSPSGTTRFKNRSVVRNMNFVEASSFSHSAKLSAVGYGPPPDGNEHTFLLHVENVRQAYKLVDGFHIPTKRWVASPGQEGHWVDHPFDPDYWRPVLEPPVEEPPIGVPPPAGPAVHSGSPKQAGGSGEIPAPPTPRLEVLGQMPVTERPIPEAAYPGGLDEAIIATVKGFRVIDDKLDIGGRTFTNVEYIGTFAYFVGHERSEMSGKATTEWSYRIEEKNDSPRDGDWITVKLEPDKSTTLETTVEAKDRTACTWGCCKRCDSTNGGPVGMLAAVGLVGSWWRRRRRARSA